MRGDQAENLVHHPLEERVEVALAGDNLIGFVDGAQPVLQRMQLFVRAFGRLEQRLVDAGRVGGLDRGGGAGLKAHPGAGAVPVTAPHAGVGDAGDALVAEFLRAETDALAGGKHMLHNSLVIHVGAVAAAEVAQHQAVRTGLNEGVIPADLQVFELNRILGVAPEGGLAMNGKRAAFEFARQSCKAFGCHAACHFTRGRGLRPYRAPREHRPPVCLLPCPRPVFIYSTWRLENQSTPLAAAGGTPRRAILHMPHRFRFVWN